MDLRGREGADRRRFPWLFAIGLFLWTLAAASLEIGHVGLVHDDGIYLVAARALRDGWQYGLPSRPGSPPPKYPIGFPLILSLGLRLLPRGVSLPVEVAAARSIVIASGILFLVATRAWLRRLQIGPLPATLIVLATGFGHTMLLSCATTVFADLTFSATSAVLIWRWAIRRHDSTALKIVGTSLADGAIAAIGLLIRTNGVSLVVGSLIAAALSPRRRLALPACSAGTALVLAFLAFSPHRNARTEASEDYGIEMRLGWSSPGAGAAIVGANLRTLASDYPLQAVLPNSLYTTAVANALSKHHSILIVIQIILGVVILLGAVTLLRRSRTADAPAWSHVVLTIAFFLIWPWNAVMHRLFLPLLPMFLLALGTGAATLCKAVGCGQVAQRRGALLALSIAALSSVSVGARSTLLFHAQGRQWQGGHHPKDLDAALEYLKMLESDAVVASIWPELVYLQTGRQSIPIVESDQLLTRHVPETTRLKRWLSRSANRPIYLLLRNPGENPDEVDIKQAASLARDPSYSLRERFASPRRGYRILSLTARRATGPPRRVTTDPRDRKPREHPPDGCADGSP